MMRPPKVSRRRASMPLAVDLRQAQRPREPRSTGGTAKLSTVLSSIDGEHFFYIGENEQLMFDDLDPSTPASQISDFPAGDRVVDVVPAAGGGPWGARHG